MPTPSPFDVPNWCSVTTWESITATREFQIAYDLCQRVEAFHTWLLDRPRFHFLFDQLSRSAVSTLLNYSEAFGKGRGYYQSAMLIARGEAYETAASISICPSEIRDQLKPLILELLPLLSSRAATAPTKP
jgi:four helix bundle protein